MVFFLYSRHGSPELYRDAHRTELARLLIDDADRFALSPRVQRWNELLAKLEDRPAAAEPYPPATAWVNSSIGQRKRRR